MSIEQAKAEAIRRSKIKVTHDGAMERIYVCYLGSDQFSVSRWIDIPMGTRLTACYFNGESQPNFEPEAKQ